MTTLRSQIIQNALYLYVYIPGILESIRIAAWMVTLAAIVPGANFGAFQLARIEARHDVHLARGSDATRFARHREMRPRIVATCF